MEATAQGAAKLLPELDTLKEALEWRRQLHRHLFEALKRTDIPEDGYHTGDLILLKIKDSHKRMKNVVRNWGPFIVLQNRGNELLQIQYADGGTGDVSIKDVVCFAFARAEAEDHLSKKVIEDTVKKDSDDHAQDPLQAMQLMQTVMEADSIMDGENIPGTEWRYFQGLISSRKGNLDVLAPGAPAFPTKGTN